MTEFTKDQAREVHRAMSLWEMTRAEAEEWVREQAAQASTATVVEAPPTREQQARSLLRALVDVRDKTIQKSRIAFSNRTNALVVGNDEAPEEVLAMIGRYTETFSMIEDQLNKDIAALVAKTEPEIYRQLIKVKGIGPMMSAKLLALIDIEQADTVSALWRFAGYGVKLVPCPDCPEEGLVNPDCPTCRGNGQIGQRERPTKGEKLPYNLRLKTTCYLCGTSFMRSNSPYRRIYDESKATYVNSTRGWTPLHCHNAALRKMIKIFLSHLWERWRTVRGLPVREPFVFEQLGHTHRYLAEDFGWGPIN